MLAVEVSDSTLGRDRRQKVPAYAAAGLGVVWVLALGADQVLERREPDRGLALYRSVRAFGRGSSLAVPETGLTVALDDLLG